MSVRAILLGKRGAQVSGPDVDPEVVDFPDGAIHGQIADQPRRSMAWLSDLNSGQIQIALVAISVLGVIVWLGSLWWQPLRLNGYGLLPSLTPAYWVGSFLCATTFLITAFKFPRKHWIVGITLALFAITLYLTPLILEGTERFSYNYVSYGYADYIVRHHEIRPDLFIYHNWPAFHILVAMLVIAGLSPMTVVILGPLISTTVFLTLIWMIALVTTEDARLAWLATGVFVVASQNTSYMVPANLGFLLALSAIALSLYLWRRPSASARTREFVVALIILLGSLTVITHLLSAVYLVLFMAALAVFRRVGFARGAAAPILALGVVLVAWQFYLASVWTLSTLPGVIRSMFQLDSVVNDTQQFALRGSVEHTQVVWLRISVYGVVAGLAGIGWLLELRGKQRSVPKLLIPALGVAVPTSIVLLTSYNGEIMSRIVGLALPFFAISTAHLAQRAVGNATLAIFILVLTLVYPVYAYGNELIDYVSPAELDATSYMIEHATGPYRITNTSLRTAAMGRIEDLYSVTPRATITFTGDPYDRESRFWGTAPPKIPTDAACSIPKYDNGSVQVYVCEGNG